MKQTLISFPLRFLLFLLMLAVVAAAFSFIALRYGIPPRPAQSTSTRGNVTVILDAGHGGEDGGAVSASGLYEKDLNLAIAQRVKSLLEANGVNVIMTRETDILLYDRNVDYHGRKKALDLAARQKIGEETPDGIFISIHMNAYPKSQYRGLQVWYSPNHAASRALADTVQSTVREHLQPENDRKIKRATSSIYLLHHLTVPAILIECGFLSNPEETELLGSEEYQQTLSFLIFLSIMDACDGGI